MVVAVPYVENLSCEKNKIFLEESHSTTLPTAPVVACVISSSTSNVHVKDVNLTAKVILAVLAVATVEVP